MLAKVYLSLADRQDMPELPTPSTPFEAAKNGMDFFRELQNEDGHFAAEYGGELAVEPGERERLMRRSTVSYAGSGDRHACYRPAVQGGREGRIDPVPAQEAPTGGRLGLVSSYSTC